MNAAGRALQAASACNLQPATKAQRSCISSTAGGGGFGQVAEHHNHARDGTQLTTAGPASQCRLEEQFPHDEVCRCAARRLMAQHQRFHAAVPRACAYDEGLRERRYQCLPHGSPCSTQLPHQGCRPCTTQHAHCETPNARGNTLSTTYTTQRVFCILHA